MKPNQQKREFIQFNQVILRVWNTLKLNLQNTEYIQRSDSEYRILRVCDTKGEKHNQQNTFKVHNAEYSKF